MIALMLSLPLVLADGDVNEWTVMLYGAGDNSSEESLLPDIEDLRPALPAAEGLRFVALIDRSAGFSETTAGVGEDFTGTRLYAFSGANAVRVDGGDEFPEITSDSEYDANMGAPETLGKFIRWAKANHPARKYALIFYSHGSGWHWCPDEQAGDKLYPAELSTYLDEEDGVDLMVFDVCLMGGLENCYEWRPGNGGFYADVMVATPNAGYPFPWGRILGKVRAGGGEGLHDPKTMTARDFGSLVVSETLVHRKRSTPKAVEGEAQGCYDLRFAGPVKQSFDALARALAQDANKAELMRLGDLSDGALNYARTSSGIDPTLPYVDAFDLCEQLATSTSFGAAVRARAKESQAALGQLVVESFGMQGYTNFQPGKNGVYVVLPNGDPEQWRSCSWLSPTMGDEGGPFGNYAWCRDGAQAENGEVDNWFELINSLVPQEASY